MAPRISTAVRQKFPTLTETFDDYEESADQYESTFQERFAPPRREPGGGFALIDAARFVSLSAHARARVLSWAMIEAINAGLAASLFLAARAHFEMAGMEAYLLWKCRQFRAGQLSESNLRLMVDRLYLGRRFSMEGDPVTGIPQNEQAVQVLNLIDAVDHIFEKEPDLRGSFREGYEWLSELCHPNAQSRLGDHEINASDGSAVFYRVPVITESDIGMTLSHANMSHIVFLHCFEQFGELVQGWERALRGGLC